jgi:hypothetical protein
MRTEQSCLTMKQSPLQKLSMHTSDTCTLRAQHCARLHKRLCMAHHSMKALQTCGGIVLCVRYLLM